MTKKKSALPDIKPQTAVAKLDHAKYLQLDDEFQVDSVAPLVGMSPTFIRKVCGRKKTLSVGDVLELLDQDAYSETIVPRSMVIDYLLSDHGCKARREVSFRNREHVLFTGDAREKIRQLPEKSVKCVVTSTPYWGLRIYKGSHFSKWADGAHCPYGHEQTPEAFLRHTTEILYELYNVLTEDGSIWWNIMDTFNTRTQIRSNAAEALLAMQGKDKRRWSEHECRRYSAGHAYLKDGEQCLIPTLIAQRAARIGYYVKTVITWAKTSTLPEPQESRVSRNLEYVLHLSKVRTPNFD